MNFLDKLISGLVLKHGGFVAVDMSEVRFGTRDETIAANGLSRSGFTSPFKATGVTTREEGVGGLAQEDQEGAWQQWLLVVAGPAVLAALAIAAIVVGRIAGSGIVPALAACALAVAALRYLAAWQTAQSEVTSHAISERACQNYQGMNVERSHQCFADNLAGYDQYPSLQKLVPAQLRALVEAEYPYADRWLARPDVQQRCRAWLAIANAEQADGR